MIVFLIAGIACLALALRQLARPHLNAQQDRRAALATVRAAVDGGTTAVTARRQSVLAHGIAAPLSRVHLALWRKASLDDVGAQLRRAGTSRRLSPEAFMAGRVALTVLGALAGLALGHGAGRVLLALAFAAAGVYLPTFLLAKAGARRAERIDADLPHFVDQLAIAVEAGMSFDAALGYLLEGSDGPLAEEFGRVTTELRVGESRKTALRSFANRVGSEAATAFANAVLASEQLGSPLADILRAQAGDLRHRRQMLAEERAQKAPVKMLFPIAIFILPVLFVVILAPAFLGAHGIL